jgi:hypothetical protein
VLKIHNMMISVSCHSIGDGSICFHTVYHHHFKQVHNTAMPTLTAPHPYLVYLLTWTLLQKAVSVMAHNGLLFRLIQPDKRLDCTFKGQGDYFEYQYLISQTQNNLFCDHFRLFIMKCTVYMLTSEKSCHNQNDVCNMNMHYVEVSDPDNHGGERTKHPVACLSRWPKMITKLSNSHWQHCAAQVSQCFTAWQLIWCCALFWCSILPGAIWESNLESSMSWRPKSLLTNTTWNVG